MKFYTFFFASLLLMSCSNKNKIEVDTIVTDATIYTVNEAFATATAMAIDNGKIVAIGSDSEITGKYESKNTVEADGKFIYPGLYDAHCHFYNFGLTLQEVDLRGTKSMDEIVSRLQAFQKKKNPAFIVGNGWDQNDWAVKKYPTKADLDKAFPDIPVVLNRVDGHAIIVNSKALQLAGITKDTNADGGQIELANGEPTGILVDNPMELVFKIIPKPTRKIQIAALLDAEKVMFEHGLTTVNDAGLDPDVIHLIDSLQKAKLLKLNVYAMITANQKNIDLYLKKEFIKQIKSMYVLLKCMAMER